jgi:hypothetical protein
MTQNGIHLNDRGYRAATWAVERSLGLAPPAWEVKILDVNGKALGRGTTLANLQAAPDRVSFTATDSMLPGGERTLSVFKLKPGSYALKVDSTAVATASAEDWEKGVAISKGPEFVQLEKLRA